METVDRYHHICLTVNSENWKEVWPKEMAFFTRFLRMHAYEINVEEMDLESSLEGLEKGLGLGPQKIVTYEESGKPKLDYFYYVMGEDMSETACLIDLIVFVTEPGQRTQPHPNMYTQGLRGLTLLVDNMEAIYRRGQEMGIEFLSEPVTDNWGDIGEVQYAVVKDAMGNPVELLQTDEVAEPGDGKVLRIFSLNQNTADLEQGLSFHVDGCGVSVAARVEHSGEAFAKANNVGADARATTCFLKGTNPDAKTYYALTQWHDPVTQVNTPDEGYTASYYRMWHWIKGNSDNVQALWDKMKPRMKTAAMDPYTYPSPAPWSDVTMSFFLDQDNVLQEFANHEEGGWAGLEEVRDDPKYSRNFEAKEKWFK